MDISVTFVVLSVTGQLWSVSAILLSGDVRLRLHCGHMRGNGHTGWCKHPKCYGRFCLVSLDQGIRE